MTEEWRDVPGQEGRYQVSNMGNVRSLPRFTQFKNGRGRTFPGKALRPNRHTSGHLSVRFDGYKPALVHRLVLYAFVGSCPAGMECCHNNGNPADNQLSNLRWDTVKANRQDAIKHGVQVRGSRQGSSKLTEADVYSIKAALRDGKPQPAIAATYGVTKECISLINTGKNWRHI